MFILINFLLMATKDNYYLSMENQRIKSFETIRIGLPRIILNDSKVTNKNQMKGNDSIRKNNLRLYFQDFIDWPEMIKDNSELFTFTQRKHFFPSHCRNITNYIFKDKSGVLDQKPMDLLTFNHQICLKNLQRSQSELNANLYFPQISNIQENLKNSRNKNNSSFYIQRQNNIEGYGYENNKKFHKIYLLKDEKIFNQMKVRPVSEFRSQCLSHINFLLPLDDTKLQRYLELNPLRNDNITLSSNLNSNENTNPSEINVSKFGEEANNFINKNESSKMIFELKILNKDLQIPLQFEQFQDGTIFDLEETIKRELKQRNYIAPSSTIQFINPEIKSKKALIKNFKGNSSSAIEVIINNRSKFSISLNGFTNRNEIPIFPKNYLTYPNKFDIYCMEKEELKSIESFSIGNQYGQITWEGKTDISYVDFSSDVEIRQSEILVYEKDKMNKPPVGSKLNKNAKVKLKHILKNERPDLISINDKINFLRRKCEQNGSIFINYHSKKDEFFFKVEHFTKYSFGNLIKQKKETKIQEENKNDEMNQFQNLPDIKEENFIASEESKLEMSFKEEMTDEIKKENIVIQEKIEIHEPLRVFKVDNEEKGSKEKIFEVNVSSFLYELLEEKELQRKGQKISKIISNKKMNTHSKFCVKPLLYLNNAVISFTALTNSNSNICKIQKYENIDENCDSFLDNELKNIILSFSRISKENHSNYHSYMELIKSNDVRKLFKVLSKSNNLVNSLIFGLLFSLLRVPEQLNEGKFFSSKQAQIYNYRIKTFYEFLVNSEEKIQEAMHIEKKSTETDFVSYFFLSSIHSNNVLGFSEMEFKKYIEKDGVTNLSLYSKLHKNETHNWILELKEIMQNCKFSSVNDILREFSGRYSKEEKLKLVRDDGFSFNFERIKSILEFFAFFDITKFDKIIERIECERFDSKVPWILSVCIPILLKDELNKNDHSFFDYFIDSERKMRNCLISQLKNQQEYDLSFLLSHLDLNSSYQSFHVESEIETFSRIAIGISRFHLLNPDNQLIHPLILKDTFARRFYYENDYIKAIEELKSNSKYEELKNIYEFKIDELILCNKIPMSEIKNIFELFFTNDFESHLIQFPLDILSILFSKNGILSKIKELYKSCPQFPLDCNLEDKNEGMNDSNLDNLNEIKKLFDEIIQLSKRICSRITIEKDEFIKGLIQCEYNSFVLKVSSFIYYLCLEKDLNKDLLEIDIENSFSDQELTMELMETKLLNELHLLKIKY